MADNEKMKLDVGLKRSKNQIKEVSTFSKSGKPDTEAEEAMYKDKSFWEVSASENGFKKDLDKHSWFWDIDENTKEDTKYIDEDEDQEEE